MNSVRTDAIVLGRLDYGEADRILNIITPDSGKLSLIAKGSRRIKSKLAGGIELFSTIEASYIKGRGEIGTLTSSRLIKYYSNIVKDIDRVQLGYEILRAVDKNTEFEAGREFYILLNKSLEILDNLNIPIEIIRLWCFSQIISIGGHTPNLYEDINGTRLSEDISYNFDLQNMCFIELNRGRYNKNHIKYLRIIFDQDNNLQIFKVKVDTKIEDDLVKLLQSIFKKYISL